MKVRHITLIYVLIAAIMLLAVPCYAAYETALVGYWKMDEASWNETSGEVEDSSAYGNDGIGWWGANTTADGMFNRAGSFDGYNDHVGIADSDSLDAGTDFSMVAWFKADDASKQQIIVEYGYTDSDGKNNVLGTENNKLTFVIRGYDPPYEDLAGTTTLEDDTWYFGAMSYDGDTVNLYLDDQLEDSASGRSMNMNADSLTRIGIYRNPFNKEYGYAFDGLIDEVAIWDRVLDANEMGAIFAGGVETFEHITTGINDALGLGYTTAQIKQLVELYVNSGDPVDINGTTWYYTTNEQFGHSIGDAWQAGGYYNIKLSSGITTAPEPASALFALAGLGLAIRRKRRRL